MPRRWKQRLNLGRIPNSGGRLTLVLYHPVQYRQDDSRSSMTRTGEARGGIAILLIGSQREELLAWPYTGCPF